MIQQNKMNIYNNNYINNNNNNKEMMQYQALKFLKIECMEREMNDFIMLY